MKLGYGLAPSLSYAQAAHILCNLNAVAYFAMLNNAKGFRRRTNLFLVMLGKVRKPSSADEATIARDQSLVVLESIRSESPSPN